MDQLPVNPAVNTLPPLSTDLGVSPSVPLPQSILEDRAQRASFGIGKEVDEIRQQIASGNEQKYREGVAAELTADRQVNIPELFAKVAIRKGSALSDLEMQSLYQTAKQNQAFVNPKAVFEQEYGKKYMDSIYGTAAVKQSSWFDDALKMFPEGVKSITDRDASYVALDEYIRKQFHDTEATLKAESWPSYLWDKAKSIAAIGFRGEVQERGNIPGVSSFAGGALGNNLEEQRQSLYRMPLKQATELVDAIKKNLAPSMFRDWSKAMMGMSRTEIVGENLGTAATLAVPGVGGLTKYALTRANILKDVRLATDGMVKINADSVHSKGIYESIFPAQAYDPKIQVLTATGDLETAALKNIAKVNISAMEGKDSPLQQATQFLTSAYDNTVDEILERASTHVDGREIANRLIEVTNQAKYNITNVIKTMMRINRTDAATATEDSVRLLREASKDDYKFLDSHFLDVKGPFHVPHTNTNWFEHQIGKADGTLFGSRDEAAAVAVEKGILLRGQAQMDRQLDLEKLIRGTEEQLKYYRAASVADEAFKAKFGPSEKFPGRKTIPDQANEFTANQKTLEQNLNKYYREYTVLGNSQGAVIKQQGVGFYLSRYVPLRETSATMRDLLLTTAASQLPKGVIRDFTGWLRGPAETFSDNLSLNARIADYGPAALMKQLKKELEPIRKLARLTLPGTDRKQVWQDFERVLKHARVERDPETGELGYLFKSHGELDDHYQRWMGRAASQAEQDAYFAFQRHLNLVDSLSALQISTQKLRLGTETHNIVTAVRGQKVTSPDIEGIVQKTKPMSDHTIYFSDVYANDEIMPWSHVGVKRQKELVDQIEKGELKVIQISDPERRPLSGYGKATDQDRIRYIISPSIDTRPLSIQKIGGKHSSLFDQEFSHYLSQANIKFDRSSKTWWYEGDKNLMGFMNPAIAKDVHKIVETVREFLKVGKEAEAKAAATKLNMDWATVKGWFEGDNAIFSKTDPFHVLPKNKMIIQSPEFKRPFGEAFRDGTREGSAIRQSFFDTNKNRDVFETLSVGDKGTKNNPIYYNDIDSYADVIPSVNRSMRKVINSTYLDDLKSTGVEHWIQEAKRYLDPGSRGTQDIERNPYHYFSHGTYLKDTPLDIQSRLESNRIKLQGILGTPSKTEAFTQFLSDKLAESVYGIGGPKLTPSWQMSKLTNGAQYARSATYHLVVGTFSIPQLMVQNMNYITIAGIEGVGKAMQGATGALFHLWASMNSHPNVIAHLDSMASHFGWRPGEWAEAYEMLRRIGFLSIGSEHSLLDNPLSGKLIKSTMGDILDAGTIFFKMGEKSSRAGAWYAAFKKFRDANPTGAISDQDLRQIFGHAELLSGNMSTASKSLLQKGPLSFATQFLAYNMRLADLATGRRLDTYQKARLFLTFASMYGVSAAGLYGYPFGDTLRKAAVNNGYVIGDNVAETLTYEGIPSALLHMITGKYYNFGQRYGSTGFDQIRDMLSGDKSFWQLLGGASYNTLSNTLAAGNGLYMAMRSIFADSEQYYPLKSDDFTEPLKNAFNSGSQGARLIAALNTKNWLDKKGHVVEEGVSTFDAIFRTMTGMQSMEAVMATNVLSSLERDRKHNMETAERHFLDHFNKAAQAYSHNDSEQGDSYMKQARAHLIAGDYPSEKWGHLMQLGLKGQESTVQRAFFNFYLRNVPPSQRELLMKSYGRTQLQGK